MQINRLFEMIYLLLDRERITAGDLAAHFEVSSRTIYRDVELLSAAGIPIYMSKGKGGGISLLPDFVLNKAVLTDAEKSDILSALHAVNAVSLAQTDTAVSKLSSLFGKSNADWVEVDFSQWSNGEVEAETFQSLKTSILEKQIVTFSYFTYQGSTTRTVEPLKLCFKGQSWYLYAYCLLRKDYRFFKLRRICELTTSDIHFERLTPAKIFSEATVFHDDFVTIVMKISKCMAYRVLDEFPQYELLPDGDYKVALSIPRGEWVYHYVSTYGEHCEVLEPQDIRLEVKSQLEKTLKQYL